MKQIIAFWTKFFSDLLGRLSRPTPAGKPAVNKTSGPSTAAGTGDVPAPASALEVDLEALNLKNALPFTHIVIHNSATKDRKVNDWASIKHYHTSFRVDYHIVSETQFNLDRQAAAAAGQSRKFEKPGVDIGYNLGVEDENGKIVLRHGRKLSIPGAHCRAQGMNTKAASICIVGAFDKEGPSKGHWKMAVKAAKALMVALKVPAEKVKGHCELDSRKTCPGLQFDMGKFRTELI